MQDREETRAAGDKTAEESDSCPSAAGGKTDKRNADDGERPDTKRRERQPETETP